MSMSATLRKRRVLLTLAVGTGLTGIHACKTDGPQTAQVRDFTPDSGLMSSLSAEQQGSWNPCGSYPRYSTSDLEKHLGKHIRHDVPWSAYESSWPFQVDEMKLKEDWHDDQLVGGFFGMNAAEIGMPVYDNLMRYQWSLDGKPRFIQGFGHGYANVIPQRNANDQPEMVKFLKDGDVIVYFHPERRTGGLSSMQQWRATHAATIMEVPAPAGSEIPCQLTTADTPSGYARPFNGSSTTPFHVFRPVHRERDQNKRYKPVDAELNFWKRTQIARYGSLAFDRFPFNGDYNSMSVKAARDLNVFEELYLKQSSRIPAMYCAWYVFTNVNLGMMRPMTPATPPPPMSFDGFNQESHRYGDGDFLKHYAVPQPVLDRYPGAFNRTADAFFMEPLTGPELAMGFLDRVLGADKFVPTGDSDGPEHWVRHAQTKITLLTQLKDQLMYLYRPRPNAMLGLNPGALFQSPEGAVPESVNQELAKRYGERVITFYDRVLAMYAKSVAPDVLSSPNAMRRIRAYKGSIRSVIADIVSKERSGVRDSGVYTIDGQEFGSIELPVFGNKWIPPYGFARHAENHDFFYEPESADLDQSKPKLVYVGTVVHEKHLKGISSSAVPPTAPTEGDLAAMDKMIEILRGRGVEVSGRPDLNKALLEHLKSLGPEKGVNEFEYQTLRTMMNHWLADTSNAQSNRLAMHNKYGLDPVLAFRTLLAYWNDPYLARPAIYEGPDTTTSMAGATENLRLLMADPAGNVDQEPHGIDEREQSMHPRRARPMVCDGGRTPTDMFFCNR